MTDRLVVIGGSAGAVELLKSVVSTLSVDFPVPVLVVVHLAPRSPSVLADILDRAGPLPVRQASHGEALKPGEVLVAPPDRHLVVHDGVVHLSNGPRENRHRPAVDALSNSAARWWDSQVIAVVLSGGLDDGAAGAAAIAARDGVVLVQDPQEAQHPGMPQAALRAAPHARTTSGRDLARLLTDLARTPPAPQHPPVDQMVTWESANVDTDFAEARGDPPGTPAALGCPECQGGMFEVTPSGRVHYLCHVGHSWSPETLLAAQRELSEAALYSAAAKLLEEATVLRRLAELAATSENPAERDRVGEYLRQADHAEHQAVDIQNMVRHEQEPT